MLEEISHGICVSNLAWRVAKSLGLPEDQCHEMAIAGVLHDIGKLEVSFYIYQREDTLKIEEMRYVRSHASLGYAMLVDEGYSDFIYRAFYIIMKIMTGRATRPIGREKIFPLGPESCGCVMYLRR